MDTKTFPTSPVAGPRSASGHGNAPVVATALGGGDEVVADIYTTVVESPVLRVCYNLKWFESCKSSGRRDSNPHGVRRRSDRRAPNAMCMPIPPRPVRHHHYTFFNGLSGVGPLSDKSRLHYHTHHTPVSRWTWPGILCPCHSTPRDCCSECL